MIHARRRVAPRLAATALAAGLLTAAAIATAGPAVAEDSPQPGGATAGLEGLTEYAGDIDVTKPDGEEVTISGGLFSMKTDDGGTLLTYCIDFNTPTARDARYQETDWAHSTLSENENAGKILWILQNSYPVVDDLGALAASAGATELTEADAAAGTQAAIWELSDGVEAVPADEDAAKLADWLLAQEGGGEEPGATVELTPAQVSGEPGQVIGPVTVHTSADSVAVAPDAAAQEAGVTLVDANGEALGESAANGDELYFSVPAEATEGAAGMTATVTSAVPVGRAFTGIGVPTQTMILAGSDTASVTVQATVTWGPDPVALTAEPSCVDGGIKVTATNNGDEPYTLTVGEQSIEVPAQSSGSLVHPVEDGQPYDFTVGDQNFTGVLDCSPEDNPGTPDAPADSGGAGDGDENEPEPATTGGSGDAGDEGDEGPDLAETGSSTNTGMIVGIAVALLVAGAAVVFFIRRKAATAGAGSTD